MFSCLPSPLIYPPLLFTQPPTPSHTHLLIDRHANSARRPFASPTSIPSTPSIFKQPPTLFLTFSHYVIRSSPTIQVLVCCQQTALHSFFFFFSHILWDQALKLPHLLINKCLIAGCNTYLFAQAWWPHCLWDICSVGPPPDCGSYSGRFSCWLPSECLPPLGLGTVGSPLSA